MRMRFLAAYFAGIGRARVLRGVVVALLWALVGSPAAAQSSSSDQLPQLQQLQQLQQLMQQRQQQGGLLGTSTQQPLAPSQTTLAPVLPVAPVGPPQPPSRLEQIMSERAGVELRQFGYDQLGVGRSVTVPQQGAVQDDYVLGVGDQIVVSLRGQENAEYRTEVDRDGRVLLPKLPPISAAGRTLGAFRSDLLAAIHRAYVATQGYVSVGQVRQVSVLVVGEVANPGTRILTGLSTPVDAILISGGIKKTGSLRDVELIRNGHKTIIDLYDLITQQGAGKSIFLADGDRIVVPPLGATVAVTGWVRRPGIYELPPGAAEASARQLLSLAGGLEVNGKYRISVLGIAANGQPAMNPANERTVLHDSDVLYVQPAAAQTTSKATLAGGTILAGRYPIAPGTKLSDLIKAPGALGQSPFTLLGIISRRDPKTYLRTLVAFSPVAVLNGHEDMMLQTDDIVRVFSVDESQMLQMAMRRYNDYQRYQAELARNPEGATLNQIGTPYDFNNPTANQEGGPRQGGAAGAAAMSAAQAAQSSSQAAAGSQAVVQSLANQSFNSQNTGIVTQSGQMQSGQLQTGQMQGNQPLYGQVGGGSSQSGQLQYGQPGYGQLQPGQAMAPNFETEVTANGGVATNQEATTFGQVASQLGITPLVLANFLSDHTVRLSGAVRGPDSYLVGPDVSLADVVQAAGGTLNWADDSGVELTTTEIDRQTGKSQTRQAILPLHRGMLANYIVQPRDDFRFRKVFADAEAGSVTLQGQVRFPGAYQITRGEHLSDLLARAGGLTNVAYPYGTIFLRKSAAALERTGYQRTADEIENQLLVGMTRRGSEQLAPAAFSSVQGFVTQLRNTKPLGRISVIADPSLLLARPAQDILLEPGDVIYIPQRPSTVAVLGRVLQPGSFPFHASDTITDYISRAGGYAQFADESETFVILPDGTARRMEDSWFNFDEPSIPPGSAIVVPRDLSPLDLHQIILDTTSIMSQLAVSAASLAVLSKQ